jgi:hypothetical protein
MLIGILGEISTYESISLILDLMEDDFIEESLFSTDIRVFLRTALFKNNYSFRYK